MRCCSRLPYQPPTLVGTAAQIAVDFIDGGPPANTVTLAVFTTDGTLGANSTSGDVTGALPGTLTLGDGYERTLHYGQIVA